MPISANCFLAYHGTSGTIERVQCDVSFVYITPDDLFSTPFVIFASFGTHSHAPPPVHKTPMTIQNELVLRVKKQVSRSSICGCGKLTIISAHYAVGLRPSHFTTIFCCFFELQLSLFTTITCFLSKPNPSNIPLFLRKILT